MMAGTSAINARLATLSSMASLVVPAVGSTPRQSNLEMSEVKHDANESLDFKPIPINADPHCNPNSHGIGPEIPKFRPSAPTQQILPHSNSNMKNIDQLPQLSLPPLVSLSSPPPLVPVSRFNSTTVSFPRNTSVVSSYSGPQNPQNATMGPEWPSLSALVNAGMKPQKPRAPNTSALPTLLRACLTTDLPMLSASEIAEIIYEHPLSEEEAQKLIHQEVVGMRREDVLQLLCAHARKARAIRVMQRALAQDIRLQSADLETLNEVEIRAMIHHHPLSEAEARSLIYAERNGHARKEVLEMLAKHAQKARMTHAIRKAYVEGLNCKSDLEVLSLSCIKSIVDRHPLSEQQARDLIVRERNFLDRKKVVDFFTREWKKQQKIGQIKRRAMETARLAAKREAAEREAALRAAYAAQAQAYEEKRVAKRKQALLNVKKTLQTKMAAEREARVQAEQACMKAKLEAVERRAAKRRAADQKLQEERERKWKLQDEAQSIALRNDIRDIEILRDDILKILNVESIKGIVQRNFFSEWQIQVIIAKEKRSRNRSCLLRYLAAKARTATRDAIVRKAREEKERKKKLQAEAKELALKACMTDVTALTVDIMQALNVEMLKSIILKNSATEAQLQGLIAKEMQGRRRTCLLRFLAGRVRMFGSKDGKSKQGGSCVGGEHSSSKTDCNGANKATNGVSGNIDAKSGADLVGACASQKSALNAGTPGKRKIEVLHANGGGECKRSKPSSTQMGCDSTLTPTTESSQLKNAAPITGGSSLGHWSTMGKTDSKNTHAVAQPASTTDGEKTTESSDKDNKSDEQLRILFSSPVDPDALIGVCIKKDFDDYGVFEGEVVSHDIDSDSGNVIFRVRYADGDEEDLFLDELTSLFDKQESLKTYLQHEKIQRI